MSYPRTLLEAFLLDGTAYHVQITWDDDEPYFRGPDIAKILEIQNLRSTLSGKSFTKDVDYTIMMSDTSNGSQPTTYLTESGLHNLLMISRKPIAQPFRRWVMHVLKEIRKKGKYELENLKHEIEEVKQSFQSKLEAAENKLEEVAQSEQSLQLKLEEAEKSRNEDIAAALQAERANLRNEQLNMRHSTLIDMYSKKTCVYMGLIYTSPTGTKTVKIGSTDNLSLRSQTHRDNFEEFFLIDVYHVQSHTSFEQFVHKHHMIAPYRHKEYTYYDRAAKKERTSHEVYLLDEEAMKKVTSIIKRNMNKFLGKLDSDAIIEHEKEQILHTRQRHDIVETEYKTVLTKKAVLEAEIEQMIHVPEVPPRGVYIPESTRPKINRGPKLQIYDPKTRTLVHTFETLLDATRENPHFPGNASKPMIATALKQHVTYKGYIWMQLARHEPDDTVQTDLPEVDVGKKSVNIGLLAMLNLNKDRVLDVFPDMKTATAARKFKTIAAISKAVIHGSISSGHYWAMWESLAPKLRADYLAAGHTLPEKARRSNSRAIEQRDGTTNELIRTFVDTETVIREVGLARKTLKGAIEGRYRVKGFMWAFAPAPAEKA